MRFTAREYEGLNCDEIGFIASVSILAATSSPSNGVATKTQVPVVSCEKKSPVKNCART